MTKLVFCIVSCCNTNCIHPAIISSGTPRQDIPNQVYRDAAMFDDVFDRQGRLFTGRKTPKITSPLNTLEYNRLVDCD